MKNIKVNELKALARELHIKNWWDMKKAELIEAIEKVQKTEPLTEDEHELVQMPGTEGEWIHPADEETSEDEPIEEVTPEAPETVEVVTNETDHENEENVSETKNETQKAAPKKKNKREYTYEGKTQNLSKWAKDLNMPVQTLYNRLIMKNWPIEKAFTEPVKKGKHTNRL